MFNLFVFIKKIENHYIYTPKTSAKLFFIIMSARVPKNIIRWSLRFCCQRFPRKQLNFLNTGYFSTHPVRLWCSKQNQKCLSRSLACSERFYSQNRNHNEGMDEINNVEQSFPTDETTSTQRPIISPFWNHLERCRSPSDVLDLTCMYSPTNHQVSNCLTHMWSSTKKMSDEQRCYELQLMFEHPEFDKLLQRAMKSVQFMRNDDITYALLSLVKLGVPQRSYVVQTFLRACQEKLNDFDEKNLSILASCLKQMDGPNVDALKEGMRLVVKISLPGIKNVVALQTMMHLLGKDSPKDLKQKLERKALSMSDQFSLPNSQHMIFTLAAMGFYSKPLLSVCSKIIAENLHNIPFTRLYQVLLSFKELLYRDPHLLTEISEYVASTLDIWTNKQLVLFLSVFEDLVFCPSALMEAYAGKVMENPNALTLKDLLCVLKVYSSFNYDLQHRRQHFLDSLSDALGSYLPNMPGMQLLKAVYCLCLLNHFPSVLLEHLLDSHVLEQLETKFPKGRDRMLQMVDLCLRLDCPPLPQPLTVPSSVLGNPSPNRPLVNPRLSRSLQRLLAGQTDTEFQETVVVENFYFVDGVITKPLPNQSCETETSSCAEEQSSPAGSNQRIAVIYAPNSSFCYDTSHPRGHLAVQIRHLQILGYSPVLVTEQDLQLVSDGELLDVLRRRIFPEHASETCMKTEDLGS
uniref:FAST kinase domains 2 n=2 Tax=Nothobranchius furzeri TaxID=105023 RepID=A0A1A8UCP7_NOTFU